MAKQPARSRTKAAPAPKAAESPTVGGEPREEDVRLRAYQRYLERGGGHGLDFDDWLEAEKELKQRNR